MKKVSITFILICFSCKLYCQSAIVNFSHINKSNKKDIFYFDLMVVPAPTNRINIGEFYKEIIGNKKNGDTSTTSVKFQVNRTTCAIIGDGFGHEVIISPGDTINIFCEIYPPDHHFLKDRLPSPWNFKMYYSGKSKANFAFFDALAYVDGDINIDYLKFHPLDDSLTTFFKMAGEQYHKRIGFLEKYNAISALTKEGYIYAAAEIRFGYLNKLLSVLLNGESSLHPKDLYKQYTDSLVAFNRNDTNLFFNTYNYSKYLNSFITFFENNFYYSTPSGDEQLAQSFTSFAAIANHDIKDYMLTNLMETYYNSRNSNFDSLLVQYHEVCTNILYKSFIDSLYKPERGKLKITLEQVFESKMISPENDTFRIKEIFKGKPVVIDCWASWCVPCLKEIPFSKKIENEYIGKVDFIYLSFDKSKKAWFTKNKQLKFSKNSYLVEGGFQSDIANYFGIVSIPHYLIFDGNGLLITKNPPRPSRKEALEKLLNNILDKKNDKL